MIRNLVCGPKVHANRGKYLADTAADGSSSNALRKWPPSAPYLPNALLYRDPSVSVESFKEKLLAELLADQSGGPEGRRSTDDPNNMAADDDDDDDNDDDEYDYQNQFETEEPQTESEMIFAFPSNFQEVAESWHSDDPTLPTSTQAQTHQYPQSSLAGDSRFISPQDHHHNPASLQSGRSYWPVEGQTQVASYDITRSQYEQTNLAPELAQEYRQFPQRTVEPRNLEGPFGNLRLRGGPQYPPPQQQQYGHTPVPPPLCCTLTYI
jgi:hypothetical protein